MKISQSALAALLILSTAPSLAESGAEQMKAFELKQMKAAIANYQLPVKPTPGKALVFVVRPASGGGLVRFSVFVDNQNDASEVGSTRSEEYIYFSLTPGTHRIYSKAGNWAEIQLSVSAGEVTFIKQETNMGLFMANNSLSLLDETEGKYRVKRLAKGNILKANDVLSAGESQTAAVDSPTTAQPAPAPVAQPTPPSQPQVPQQQASGEQPSSVTSPTSVTSKKLRELQSLWKEGLLSDEEYKVKKRELLEKL